MSEFEVEEHVEERSVSGESGKREVQDPALSDIECKKMAAEGKKFILS